MAKFYEYGGHPDETMVDQMMYREREKQCLRTEHRWLYSQPGGIYHHTGCPSRMCQRCSRVELLDEDEKPPEGARFLDEVFSCTNPDCPGCKGDKPLQ